MSKADGSTPDQDPAQADGTSPGDHSEQAPDSKVGDDLPWWRAGDAMYAGARPLFDPAAPPQAPDEPDADETPTAESSTTTGSGQRQSAPTPDSAGSTITEALKFASAIAAWSNETGLTDTLQSLWEEAAVAMTSAAATAAPADNPHDSAAADTPAHTGDRADETRSADAPPPVHLRIVDSDDESTAVTCDFCPLCRGYDVLRQVQPQMSEGLAEAMASLTAALNLAIDSLTNYQQRP